MLLRKGRYSGVDATDGATRENGGRRLAVGGWRWCIVERLINWKKQKKRCFILLYFLLSNGVMFSHSALCPRGMKTNVVLFYICSTYIYTTGKGAFSVEPPPRQIRVVIQVQLYKNVNG